MSVLIKGMEMPTNCDECELCTCYVREDGTEENYRCVITFYPIHEFDERHEYCPLVEIPPHGRLVDADELFKEMERKGWFDNADRDIAEDLVLATPTIIESTIGQLNSDPAVNEANANTSNALNALEQENKEDKEEVTDRNVGKWMHKKITNELHVIGQCSVCKEIRRIDNFCPNCGADMRERKDK